MSNHFVKSRAWRWLNRQIGRGVFCSNCNDYVHLQAGDTDTQVCPTQNCGRVLPTGRESQHRQEIERNVNGTDGYQYPPIATSWAIVLSCIIYKLATRGSNIRHEGAWNDIIAHAGTGTDNRGFAALDEFRRGVGDRLDNRVGVKLFAVSGRNTATNRNWYYIYIVFRGSRGDPHADNSFNELGAGWSEDGVNIDWAANFTNRQVAVPWGAAGRVHEGFLGLYQSVSDQVLAACRAAIAEAGSREVRVITTGHSLGAALAQLCASHLNEHKIRASSYAFCPPKVGDYEFARGFRFSIANSRDLMPSDQGSFHRAFSFTQWNDKVSSGGEHGFRDADGDAAFDPEHAASRSGTPGRVMHALGQRGTSRHIFYLAPNVYQVSVRGFHDYHYMQSQIMGVSATYAVGGMVNSGRHQI